MPEIAFRISPRTMRMLGRQNVSSQFVAINELVKNAYDADSPDITIEFKGPTRLGPRGLGSIILTDHGTGMDLETITTKWLTIGTDNKEQEPISRLGRIRTGAKGIGRFALDRLGEISIIETYHSINDPGIRITIDWRKYDDFQAGLESVTHKYEQIVNQSSAIGTKIIIQRIRDSWNEDDMQELYEDLSFLIPPLQPEHMEFSIRIDSDDFPELNGTIEPTDHDKPEFLLNSELLSDGSIVHQLKHKSGEFKRFETQWSNLFEPPLLFPVLPACGPARVALRIFIGPEGKKVTTVNVRDTAFKKYLKSFRGIRIYRDGFLVKPYGLKNSDWLGLAPRKIRNNQGVLQADLGDYKFSNHQIIGKVDISRIHNPNLEDRTNREGLIDNNAFKDLKRYLMECISYVEYQRQILETAKSESSDNDSSPREVIEKAKTKSRKKKVSPRTSENAANQPTESNNEKSGGNIYPTEDTLSPASTEEMTGSLSDDDIDQIIDASQKLISENDMLRTLSTIGISAVTLSHELKGDLLSLNAAQKIVAIELRKSNIQNPIILDEVTTIASNTSRMNAWADLILKRTQMGRRREIVGYIDPIIFEIVQNFIKTAEGQNFSLNLRIVGEAREIRFRAIDLEAILINLISNSIKALKRSRNNPKLINILVAYEEVITISVEDTGTGVRRHDTVLNQEEAKMIFEPLVSLNTDDGTGMGLSIVNAICKDNNWNIEVNTLNDSGGATFTIHLNGSKNE